MHSMANAVQAALPTVLKILPTAITAGVAIYAGANWLSYSRLRRMVRGKSCFWLALAQSAGTWPCSVPDCTLHQALHRVCS